MFELFGHPSTLLCDNTSIVMASQIYERVFTTTKKEYADIKTISEYFTKRNELKEGSRRQNYLATENHLWYLIIKIEIE